MMYKMGPNGERIRQLTFEQDHDYTPSVLNNGRVLYLRWDYTDTPHVWNRLLMSMNPDGTGQMEYTGANSYWPNAMFFARAIPNHPTKIVTIVTGHHEGRVGELFIFDPAKGRHETDGVVQRIPRKGPPVAAEDRGQADRAQLAQVPASLAAFREVFPRRLQARAGRALGHLPRGCVRQHDAGEGGGRRGAAGTRAAAPAAQAAGHRGPGRSPDRKTRWSIWRTSTAAPA